jgi:error-prone DNA polymerase
LGQLHYQEEELDLVHSTDTVELPPLSEAEALMTEYELLGLSTGDHVMALHRPWLEQRRILGSWELKTQPSGKRVRVAGLVVVHQAPPTAKNFHFVTIEDERGLLDVVIKPLVYANYRRILHTARLLVVEGTVQQENGVVNLLAERIVPLLTSSKEIVRTVNYPLPPIRTATP